MLNDGHTLGEINSKLHIWYELPEHLENVNKYSRFNFERWINCGELFYYLVNIGFNGDVKMCGCWNENLKYYDEQIVYITDYLLKNPTQNKSRILKEELWCIVVNYVQVVKIKTKIVMLHQTALVISMKVKRRRIW